MSAESQAAELRSMPVGEAFLKEEQKFMPGAVWQNWVGVEGGCAPDHHHRPSTVEEVSAIVKQAYKDGSSLKVVGSGHSPSNIAFSGSVHNTGTIPTSSQKKELAMKLLHGSQNKISRGGHLLHLKESMQRVTHVDTEKLTVTCEGGCTMDKLFTVLDHQDLMLPICVSVGNITVAGALSVAAHSSGINKPTLSAAVIAMTVVTGTGEIIKVDARSGENAELLPALRCGLGVLGVICNVTLQVERKSIFKIVEAPISLAKLNSTLARKVTMTESYRFWYVPHTDMCFEVSVNKIAPSEDGRQSMVGSAVASTAAASSIAAEPGTGPAKKANLEQRARRNLNRAIQLVRPLHSEERSYVEWMAQEQSAPRRFVKSLQCPRVGAFLTETGLYAAALYPRLQPAVNEAYRRCYLNSEVIRYGTIRDAFNFNVVLPQRACEWAVAAPRCLEIIEGLRELIRRNGFSVHFIVECRFVDEDDVWMSPCYKRKSCYIGVVQFRPFNKIDAPHSEKIYSEFSNYVASKGGRAHWAKYAGANWDFNAIYKSYPKWRDFLAVQKQLDPKGLFINDWFRHFMPTHSKL